MSKIREKECLECVRMHIWASKTQKLPGPLSGPWTPCRRMLASLARLHFATSATVGLRSWGPPLTKSWIRTCRSNANLNQRLKCVHDHDEWTRWKKLPVDIKPIYPAVNTSKCMNGTGNKCEIALGVLQVIYSEKKCGVLTQGVRASSNLSLQKWRYRKSRTRRVSDHSKNVIQRRSRWENCWNLR